MHNNAFPHTTNLQQTTLKTYSGTNLSKEKLLNKVENIVVNREIAHYDYYHLLKQCFQKANCCRGVRNRLNVGKGYLLNLFDMHKYDEFFLTFISYKKTNLFGINVLIIH